MSNARLRWLTERPIAHRGYHDIRRGRPENTLAAFEAAIQARYAIECDLHIGADGVPFVFHDDELERLTGARGPVRDRTIAELARLKVAGSVEHIPSLDDLLALTAGRVPLVIELKHIAGRDAGLVATTIERLKAYSGQAAVMSFAPSLIAAARALEPEVPRGLTALGRWRTAPHHLKAALKQRVDFISYAIDDLPTPMPILARALLGIPLICWTVRTREQREKARRWTDQITFEGFEA